MEQIQGVCPLVAGSAVDGSGTRDVSCFPAGYMVFISKANRQKNTVGR